MANWTTIATKKYNGSGYLKGLEVVKVQYDKDRTTPTKTYIRFKPVMDGSTYTDGVYILYNANNYPDDYICSILMPFT